MNVVSILPFRVTATLARNAESVIPCTAAARTDGLSSFEAIWVSRAWSVNFLTATIRDLKSP